MAMYRKPKGSKKTMWTAKTKSGNTTRFKITGSKKHAFTTYRTKKGKRMTLHTISEIIPSSEVQKYFK